MCYKLVDFSFLYLGPSPTKRALTIMGLDVSLTKPCLASLT